jgi:hypothetical protein
MSGAVEKLLFTDVKQIPPTDSWHEVDSDRCNFHPLMTALTLVSLLERSLVLGTDMPRGDIIKRLSALCTSIVYVTSHTQIEIYSM